jgi:hypothetical protein
MNGRRLGARTTALLFAVAAAVSTAACAQGALNPLPLAKKEYAADAWRIGYDMTGIAPEKGYTFKVKQQTFVLFDQNEDGALGANGVDGMAVEGSGFVVAIPKFLLCDLGWCEVSFNGVKTITLDPKPAPIEGRMLAGFARLNEIRMRHGAPSLMLDAAYSALCAKHLDYLEANGVTAAKSAGVKLNDEQPDKPGFSAEGRGAAELGTILPIATIDRDGIHSQLATAWARHTLMSRKTRLGVAVNAKIGFLMYAAPDHWNPPDRPFFFPCDRSQDIDRAFYSGGETPGPEPDGKNGAKCGFPVTVQLPKGILRKKMVSFVLYDGKSNAVPGWASAPGVPANANTSDNLGGVALFLPKAPLAAGMTYMAELEFENRPRMAWSFTTRK